MDTPQDVLGVVHLPSTITTLTLGLSALRFPFIILGFYVLAYPIYALYLHPLRTYPGPRLSAITRLPYWIACLKGDQVKWLSRLHREYGPVVRFSPDDLSYSDGQAWRDICAVHKGRKENGKEVRFHAPPANGVYNMVAQRNASHHAAVRRVFSPAFSERGLKAQEPLFRKYADQMVSRAREATEVDMAQLFNFTTFDIMADFAFGESLQLLEKYEYSPWLSTVFRTVRVLPLVQMIEFYPLTRKLFAFFEPRAIAEMRLDHFNHTVTRVNKRLREGSQKPDLWDLVLKSEVLTLSEMHINAELFMTAGTESTASLLTGLMYYLVTNRDKLKILADEVRQRFGSNKDITLEALASLPYLNACLKEGLRIYPPVPSGIPREVAEGGSFILGRWVPEGTRVSVHQISTYRSPTNFKNPDKFAPERWLGDREYINDRRDAHQPFSVGPRNCLGMNMAWHEMRLLLAKLVYEFDIESAVGPDWPDQKVYVIWHRKPLICRLRPRNS